LAVAFGGTRALKLIPSIRKMFIGGLNWETTDRMYSVYGKGSISRLTDV
jgi:hypothetical protein